jgi:protein phosphatase
MGVVDTWVFPPHPGEAFVVCSDGLSNELTKDEIEALLREGADAEATATELVRRAVEAGGRDNVTAIVIRVPDDAGS